MQSTNMEVIAKQLTPRYHKVERVDNLMYKGCEPHWRCIYCEECIPFHCYTKQDIENMICRSAPKE